MEARVIVSGGGLLRVFSLPDGALKHSVPFAGAGALCCGRGHVYCASTRSGAVLRLDADTLMPQALFAGGPGVCGLLLHGRRLYALCGEGDGVLMMHSGDGSPMVFAHTGLSPVQMAMEEGGGVLVVAGGEGSVLERLCAHTLNTLSSEGMPGPVLSAAAHAGRQYALCLNDRLCALVITVERDGSRNVLELPGMPGALAYDRGADALLAAVQGGIYTLSPDGRRVLGMDSLPGVVCGMGSRLLCRESDMLLLDAARQRLWVRVSGQWLPVCGDAADAALLDA